MTRLPPSHALAVPLPFILTARKQGWKILDTFARPDPDQLIARLRLQPEPLQPAESSA